MSSYTTEITSNRFGDPSWQQPQDVRSLVRQLLGDKPGAYRFTDEVFTNAGKLSDKDASAAWLDTVSWNRGDDDLDRYTVSGGVGGLEHAATLIMHDEVALGLQETEHVPDTPGEQDTSGTTANIASAEISSTPPEEVLARMYQGLDRITRGNYVQLSLPLSGRQH